MTKDEKEDRMNPKVIETWISETLTEAELQKIPGVILKPESKTPICRYQIDRESLEKLGIPPDLIDRVY